jgi:hypothetical protein
LRIDGDMGDPGTFRGEDCGMTTEGATAGAPASESSASAHSCRGEWAMSRRMQQEHPILQSAALLHAAPGP